MGSMWHGSFVVHEWILTLVAGHKAIPFKTRWICFQEDEDYESTRLVICISKTSLLRAPPGSPSSTRTRQAGPHRADLNQPADQAPQYCGGGHSGEVM